MPLAVDAEVIKEAWLAQDRYRLSWRDSLIVAAARLLGCRYILTEDLRHGQDFDGVVAINPFLKLPEDL